MKVESLFSQADLDAIKQAVQEVEKHTSGEVVPYVVGASDEYEGARWRAAALATLLAAGAAALTHELGGYWGGWFALWLLLPVVGGGLIGYALATFIPELRRMLIDGATLDHHVHQRAESAFLHEEVFHTEERSGILIFLSLFERRVVILGDSGINAKVQQHEWDDIVRGLVSGIRAGELARALIEGIARCGRLLERRGVEIRPEDSDELPDDLRLADR